MRDYRGVDLQTGQTDRGPRGDSPPQKVSRKQLDALRRRKAMTMKQRKSKKRKPAKIKHPPRSSLIRKAMAPKGGY